MGANFHDKSSKASRSNFNFVVTLTSLRMAHPHVDCIIYYVTYILTYEKVEQWRRYLTSIHALLLRDKDFLLNVKQEIQALSLILFPDSPMHLSDLTLVMRNNRPFRYQTLSAG